MTLIRSGLTAAILAIATLQVHVQAYTLKDSYVGDGFLRGLTFPPSPSIPVQNQLHFSPSNTLIQDIINPS